MAGNRSINEEDEESNGPQHEQTIEVKEEEGDNDIAPETPATKSNNKSSSASASVQVAVRVRPLLSSLESGCAQCIDVMHAGLNNDGATMVKVGGESGPTFTFDEVFPTSATQVQVFEHRVAPLVESCLEGYNATILAYGQTGSGTFFFFFTQDNYRKCKI